MKETLVPKPGYEFHFCYHIPNTFTAKGMFWSINGESEWTWHTQVPLSTASSFFKFIMYFWRLLFCNSGVTVLLLLSNNVILRSGRGLDEFCIKISSGTSFCRKCPSKEIITVKRKKHSQSIPPPVRERQMLQQREHGDAVLWRWRRNELW